LHEEAMNMKHYNISSSGLRWLVVTVLVLVLDRASKQLAIHYLVAGAPLPVFPHFNLTLVFNRGAVFGFLATGSGWQNWFFSAIAIVATLVIVVLLAHFSWREKWSCFALALIAGGAPGNLADRLLYGHVIDFFDFYMGKWHFAVFNIADSAICIGVFMLLLDALRQK